MKVSLKVEYSLRVLTQLAKSYPSEQWIHIEPLSKAEAVPSNYLVQILNELRNGSLVVSRRGKQGGYQLARSPQEITVADVLQVVDADLMGCSCSELGESGKSVAALWRQMDEILVAQFRSQTLEQLSKPDEDMYYI